MDQHSQFTSQKRKKLFSLQQQKKKNKIKTNRQLTASHDLGSYSESGAL